MTTAETTEQTFGVNRLILGDNLDVLKTLPAGYVDLVYAYPALSEASIIFVSLMLVLRMCFTPCLAQVRSDDSSDFLVKRPMYLKDDGKSVGIAAYKGSQRIVNIPSEIEKKALQKYRIGHFPVANLPLLRFLIV